MLSLHQDPEEEAQLRRERDEAEARGYPAWAADWHRAYMASQPKGWTIAQRKAFYENVLAETRPDWDQGRIYLMANTMGTNSEFRGATYTQASRRRDEEAERVDYGKRRRVE